MQSVLFWDNAAILFSGKEAVKIIRIILTLACLNLVVACGQKGDLYFPEQRAGIAAFAGSVSWLESYGLL